MTSRKNTKANSNGGGQTVGAATFQIAYSASSLGINNVGFVMECVLIGLQASTGKGMVARMRASFSVVSGTFTQHGSTTVSGVGDSSLLPVTCGLDVSGGTAVRLFVTGLAGKTIDWMPWVDIRTGEM